MKFDRIDRTLSVCKSHLEKTKSFNTEIDSLLAGIVLVVAYAEFESYVKKTLEDRLLVNTSKDFRGMLTSQLAEVLEGVKKEYEVTFKQKTNAHQRQESYYNNIITNRHNLAHGSGANATFQVSFQEVERFYAVGHIVLDLLSETVQSISPEELPN